MTTTFVSMILTIIAVIMLGAFSPTPAKWVAITLGVLALLLLVLGGVHLSIGR